MNKEQKDALIADLQGHRLLSVKRRMKDLDRNDVVDTVVGECLVLSRNDSDEDSEAANHVLIALVHSGIEPREVIERATRQS